MPSLLVTPVAQKDIIWYYIAQDNIDAADLVYENIQASFERLCIHPRSGTLFRAKRPALSKIRCFPVKKFPNYLIYYQEQGKDIEIIRILHGHRDRKKLLLSPKGARKSL